MIKTIVVTIGVLALSVACTTDDSESSVGGDGKNDSADCTALAYRTWLVDDYLVKLRSIGTPITDDGLIQARAAAMAQPCERASDDAYLVWLEVWKQQWTPIAAAHEKAKQGVTSSSDGDTAYAAVLATAPDAAQINMHAALAAARPPGGPRGEQAWVQVYQPFERSLRLPLVGRIRVMEPGFTIDSAEQALHTMIADARPRAELDKAFAVWVPVFDAALSDATDVVDPAISPSEQSFLDAVAATIPESHGDVDYLAWFQIYQPRSAKDGYALNDRKIAQLAALESIRPVGGGPRSYAAWLTDLAGRFTGLTAFTAKEEAAFARFLAIKPCGTSPELVAAHGRIQTNTAKASAPIRAIVDASGPSACE